MYKISIDDALCLRCPFKIPNCSAGLCVAWIQDGDADTGFCSLIGLTQREAPAEKEEDKKTGIISNVDSAKKAGAIQGAGRSLTLPGWRKCPECEVKINQLEYVKSSREVFRFRLLQLYPIKTDYQWKDRYEAEDGEDEFRCPLCGITITTEEKDAIKFLSGGREKT